MSDELNAELTLKSNEGNRYHANLANAVQLSYELETLNEANRIVRGRAVNPADLALNLQYFYRIEKETAVKYSDLRQVAGDNSKLTKGLRGISPVYISVGYTLSVQGDFPNIINFLRSLEQGAHFYRLKDLIAEGKTSNITLNMNVDLLGRP